MVKLNRIYTRTGDKGTTALADGQRRSKTDLRVETYGTVDETNACIGMVRLHTQGALDGMLGAIQNDLFDLGADVATPLAEGEAPGAALRIVASQVTRLEQEIDRLNDELSPLTSFVLPAGDASASALHLARAIARRAERSAVAATQDAALNPLALAYLNRLSDYLFVAARWVNQAGAGDVLWVPGAQR